MTVCVAFLYISGLFWCHFKRQAPMASLGFASQGAGGQCITPMMDFLPSSGSGNVQALGMVMHYLPHSLLVFWLKCLIELKCFNIYFIAFCMKSHIVRTCNLSKIPRFWLSAIIPTQPQACLLAWPAAHNPLMMPLARVI